MKKWKRRGEDLLLPLMHAHVLLLATLVREIISVVREREREGGRLIWRERDRGSGERKRERASLFSFLSCLLYFNFFIKDQFSIYFNSKNPQISRKMSTSS